MWMLQVVLYPCERDYASKWEEQGDARDSGRLPHCKGAPGVCVACRGIGLQLDESAFALLQPELGGALDEAAERALNSLDVALPDFETDYSGLEGFF